MNPWLGAAIFLVLVAFLTRYDAEHLSPREVARNANAQLSRNAAHIFGGVGILCFWVFVYQCILGALP